MNNLIGYIEQLVMANMELKRVNAELYNDDLDAAVVDIDYTLEKLCKIVGMDKEVMELTRRRAA